MSRKVLLATFGTLGDIYPFVAIAKALAAPEAAACAPTLARARSRVSRPWRIGPR